MAVLQHTARKHALTQHRNTIERSNTSDGLVAEQAEGLYLERYLKSEFHLPFSASVV
jgi:hypothetical protein